MLQLTLINISLDIDIINIKIRSLLDYKADFNEYKWPYKKVYFFDIYFIGN